MVDLYREIIDQMVELMHKHDGIGLAAAQVGWDARVFVMNTTQKTGDDLIFINPKILDESGDIIEFPEGCLSFPGIFGPVDRYRQVTVEATDLDGELFTVTNDSLAARCMLHEIDHLDGVLFIDKAKNLYKGQDPL
jgi:peptide deformylase